MAKWSPKDPQDIRDYFVDFSSLLGEGETIATATVEVEEREDPDAPYMQLALVSDSLDTPMVQARFSGGAPGDYAIQYHITTSSGQEFDLTKTLKVKERTA